MIHSKRWGRGRLLLFLLFMLFGSISVACAEPNETVTLVPTLPSISSTASNVPSSSLTPSHIVISATNTAVASTNTAATTATPTPAPSYPPTATHAPALSPTPTLVVLTETPACAETKGQIQLGTFSSAVIGQEQPYRVYLPPCYEFSDDRYPVLYMLHGYPLDSSHWDDLGIDEAADAGISDGSLPPFIIAMPAADSEGTYTKTSGGAGSFEAVLLDEFLPFIENTYRIVGAPEGRAIGGMSRGGVWSLEIAFRNPDRFSAVGGHSAAVHADYNLAPPVYNPINLAADPSIRTLRIYLDSGKNDWALPGMEDLRAALTAAGVQHDYELFDGFHDDSYWSEHVGDYLAFYAAEW
jgi:enterochelin esterase-like enzyme